MNFLKLSLAIINTALVALAGYVLSQKPEWFWGLIFGLLLIVFGIVLFAQKLNWKSSLNASFVAVSALLFVFLLKAGVMYWVFLGLMSVLVFLFFWSILENKNNIWFTIGNLASIFVISYSLITLKDFFEIPDWVWLITMLAASFGIFNGQFRKEQRGLFYAIVGSLAISELFWVVNFWPTAPLVNAGFILLIFYYLANILQAQLREQLDRGRFLQWTIITIVLVTVILATAKWIPQF